MKGDDSHGDHFVATGHTRRCNYDKLKIAWWFGKRFLVIMILVIIRSLLGFSSPFSRS